MLNESFFVEEKDLETAKDICRYITNPEKRNKAVANSMAANIAGKYFQDNDGVDTVSGLHNVPSVISDMEISDIYVNGAYVDVRLYFNENELCIPSENYKKGLLPAAYMFIRLEQDVSGGTVTGFLIPSMVNTDDEHAGYYKVNESDLISYYDVESHLSNYENIEIDDSLRKKVLELLDGTLGENRYELYKTLINSAELREFLIRASKLKTAFNFISINDIVNRPAKAENHYEEVVPAEEEEMFGLTDEIQDYEPAAVEAEDSAETSYSDTEEFSTSTTPSMTSLTEEDLEDIADEEEAPEAQSYAPGTGMAEEAELADDKAPQLDNLFGTETEEVFDDSRKKRKSPLPVLVFLLLLLIGGGYFGYTKFKGAGMPPEVINDNQEKLVAEDVSVASPAQDAMPVESVENVKTEKSANEVSSVSIPAIERNLNASVVVSNLSVSWEVPSGCASNINATRYFSKLGKILQLNLKAELLLLSKPPISNKIMLELEFNKDTQTFGVKSLTMSSGEPSVDKVIIDTVRTALSRTYSTNMKIFENQGNPVLIIKL